MTKREEKRLARMRELVSAERAKHAEGYAVVAGIDEAGRGALAGPVVAACVSFWDGDWVPGVDDSKKLTAKRRSELFTAIREKAAAWATGLCDVHVIEDINILEATRVASLKSLEGLGVPVDYLFTDSLSLDTDVPFASLVGADRRIYCVAAASIVAKVTRDRIMDEMDRRFPGYGFSHNKGYGTKEHCEAILRLGVTPVHRPTFLRRLLAKAPGTS